MQLPNNSKMQQVCIVAAPPRPQSSRATFSEWDEAWRDFFNLHWLALKGMSFKYFNFISPLLLQLILIQWQDNLGDIHVQKSWEKFGDDCDTNWHRDTSFCFGGELAWLELGRIYGIIPSFRTFIKTNWSSYWELRLFWTSNCITVKYSDCLSMPSENIFIKVLYMQINILSSSIFKS